MAQYEILRRGEALQTVLDPRPSVAEIRRTSQGPVVGALSLLGLDRTSGAPVAEAAQRPARARLQHLLPWFIMGFGAISPFERSRTIGRREPLDREISGARGIRTCCADEAAHQQ